MFKDEAKITITSGSGGSGAVHWHREKYVAKGGPDGGDGGKGGDIFFIVDDNTDTLSGFLSKKKYKAEAGANGMKNRMHGKNGENLIIKVPPGTIIIGNGGKQLADLQKKNEKYLAAKGGRGGFGNWHFKAATRQRPDFAELGEPGTTLDLQLELKLVADVGIVGYPSAGKSTLISVISAAKPEIGAYEFTTIVPNLGVVNVDDRSYVVCDIPGIIEGASDGKGLGIQFLKHIERCGILVHLLDIGRASSTGTFDINILIDTYKKLRKELESYSPALAQKRELIVLNKIDLLNNDDLNLEKISLELKQNNIDVFASISAATSKGTEDLKKHLLPIVLDERHKISDLEDLDTGTDEIPTLRPQIQLDQMDAYTIEQVSEGCIVIHGKRLEQLTAMTEFSSDGAVRRFRDVCERIGLTKALNQHKGATKIMIGEKNVLDVLEIY